MQRSRGGACVTSGAYAARSSCSSYFSTLSTEENLGKQYAYKDGERDADEVQAVFLAESLQSLRIQLRAASSVSPLPRALLVRLRQRLHMRLDDVVKDEFSRALAVRDGDSADGTTDHKLLRRVQMLFETLLAEGMPTVHVEGTHHVVEAERTFVVGFNYPARGREMRLVAAWYDRCSAE